jgi:predicted RecB family nuclease
MEEGAEVIYQACLRAGPFLGYADFLRRVPHPSRLGEFGYEVVDTKLARSPRAKFIVQLCLYSDLLAEAQGELVHAMHVVLGDGTEHGFRVADFFHYYRQAKARFLEHVAQRPQTYPEPCASCEQCHWRELCRERWEKDNHLCRVANITRAQIDKLEAGGVRTLARLAGLRDGQRVQGIQPTTMERLRHQAALQLHKRETGKDRCDVLPVDTQAIRGFLRLPRPDAGDLFFDMEGDPLEEGGLEYLFGVHYREDGEPRFREFWAHDRGQERQAFRDFMTFVMEHLERHPDAYVYHYSPYEETALKRLMSLHGLCEAEVDHLLRSGKLLDLYRVVREAIRVSEPAYSIKNLEVFYADRREGEVTTAGASIVYYEQWKETQDPKLLEEIRAYNEADCRSLFGLREWLLTLRPKGLPWHKEHGPEKDESEQSRRVHELEARLAGYREALLADLPEDRALWDADAHLRELAFQLLDFHRRADKPLWWALYARREMDEDELIDDPECIGGLVATEPPEPVRQSLLYTYRFPEQEFKFKRGDQCLRADTLERAGTIEAIDENRRLLRIKLGNKSRLPDRLSIVPKGPVGTGPLREALFRFADSLPAR